MNETRKSSGDQLTPAGLSPQDFPQTLVVATYNVGNPSDAKCEADLVRLLSLEPHALALEEIGDRQHVVARVCERTGYRPVIRNLGKLKGARHTGLLVRPDVPISSSRIMLLTERRFWPSWIARRVAGAQRTGASERKFLLDVALGDRRRGWSVMPVHLVPSIHAHAMVERHHRTQVRKIRARMVTRLRTPVALGDWNAVPTHRNLRLLLKIAHLAPPRASHGRRAIDLVFVGKRRGVSVESSEALEGYSSDHRPVIAVLRKARP